MRGLGAFQQAQMKRGDSRMRELFLHLRGAIDVIEQLLVHPLTDASPSQSSPPNAAQPTAPLAPIPSDQTKLAYSIKETCELVGLGRGRLYEAIGNKELRAVKCGRRTIILRKVLQAWIDSWPAATGGR